MNQNYVRPVAFTKIRGSANNQFSFSEYKGYLRVATTNLYGDSQTSSNVYVLGNFLQTISTLASIDPTEKIYSCRYVDDKLYLVTFRRVDPFFVIDLSDPYGPTILGELKIEGYSSYLQPYDGNTIIGLGRNVNSTTNAQ